MLKTLSIALSFCLIANQAYAGFCGVFDKQGIEQDQGNPLNNEDRLQIKSSGKIEYSKPNSNGNLETHSIPVSNAALTVKEKWALTIGQPKNNFKITGWSPNGQYAVVQRFIQGSKQGSGSLEVKVLDVTNFKEVSSQALSFFVKGYDYTLPRSWLPDYADYKSADYAVVWDEKGGAAFQGTFAIREPQAGQIMMGYTIFTRTLNLATWNSENGLQEIKLVIGNFFK